MASLAPTEFTMTEASIVQFPMVRHAAEVGWEPLPPADARQKRGGDAGMLFRDDLDEVIRRFNPWIGDAARTTVEKLEALPATIDGNREMLAWLRGERQCYDEVEKRQRRVQLVDFENPSANALHVTWEWRFRRTAGKSNRADVMFVVNGVPLAIVEHKNPTDANAIEKGIEQIRRYGVETPELLGTAQLFNVTHMLDYWYGVTWNISRRYMARWKERSSDSYRSAVQSFFDPAAFLRTLRDWILFYVEDGETRKSVLRQHQRHAVDRIVERCEEPAKRRGLVWHTQGSGKTFTLLTAARIILERKAEFGNPTVIVVVDRTDLEGQLKGWVDRLIGEMQQQAIAVSRADSKDDLRALINADFRGLVLSTIHKFEGMEKDASTRDNIYVFIDEAHRSVAKDLGTYLMAAVPNSTIIGFTGTPIARTAHGEGTFKIFGADDERGYLDQYTIAESIEDETTLPLRHTMAPSEMTVPADRLDKEFFALAETEGVTDVDDLNRVLDKAVNLRTFLTADDRIEKVATFIAEHFREYVEPLGYKALVVGVNREACAKYKRALDKHLPPEWTAPVYTKHTADIVDRPLVAELQLSTEREADVRLRFKIADEAPKILIVTDKLLTGYDAPILYCMYLDKPMRNHVLLQAMARVNRPYVDLEGGRKRIGLVVDFVGVLRELKKALQFQSSDVSGAIEDLDLLVRDFRDKISVARAAYLDHDHVSSATEAQEGRAPASTGEDLRLEQILYKQLLPREAREEFFTAYKDIEALWEILSPSVALRDHIDTYKLLAKLYTVVRHAYSDHANPMVDLARKTRRLVERSATMEGPDFLKTTVTFDVRTVETLQNETASAEAKVFNLVRGFRREVDDDPEVAPILWPLRARAETILKNLEERTVTGLAAMDLLSTLAREKEAAVNEARQSGLTLRAFGVYCALKDEESLQNAGIDAKAVALEGDSLLARFPNAAVDTDERKRLRAALYQPLLRLDREDRARIVGRAATILLGREDDAGA